MKKPYDEEINAYTGPKDHEFGWGFAVTQCPNCEEQKNESFPLVSWQPTDTAVNAVPFVGTEYSGLTDQYDGLMTGKVVYGDMCYGWLKTAHTDGTSLTDDSALPTLPAVTGMAEGGDGFLYFTTLSVSRPSICGTTDNSNLVGGIWRLVRRQP